MNKWLSKKDAAARLGVQVWKLEQIMRSGELPYVKHGDDSRASVRISVKKCDKYLKRRTVSGRAGGDAA
jgi:hypothetical protein